MQSRSTFSGGVRKSEREIQQSRRASAVSIPTSLLSSSIHITPQFPPPSSSSSSSTQQPPQPPPPPPRRISNESKSRDRRFTSTHSKATTSSLMYSLVSLLQKQHTVWIILQQSKYFHLWRREIISIRESMKTRSERTTALMLGGVSEGSLDSLEPTKRKSTKLGISLMRWILVSMTSRNLTRAWRTWVEYVILTKLYLL